MYFYHYYSKTYFLTVLESKLTNLNSQFCKDFKNGSSDLELKTTDQGDFCKIYLC